MKILTSIMLFSLVSYIFINNPMFCCFFLMMFAFTSGWVMVLSVGFSWIFYMFLLIFLGGIIVMFVFFCSVLPNECSFSYNNIYIFILSSMMFLPMFGTDSDGLVHSLKILYSFLGMNYFLLFFILFYFIFFAFLTYSKGFSMRSYFFFNSLIENSIFVKLG